MLDPNRVHAGPTVVLLFQPTDSKGHLLLGAFATREAARAAADRLGHGTRPFHWSTENPDNWVARDTQPDGTAHPRPQFFVITHPVRGA